MDYLLVKSYKKRKLQTPYKLKFLLKLFVKGNSFASEFNYMKRRKHLTGIRTLFQTGAPYRTVFFLEIEQFSSS
jgi:hypothetical protein